MQNEKLHKTPLHRCHLQLGAKMVPFAGYEMPVQYTSVLDEAKSARREGGLFDVSHMGQFSIRGNTALEEIERLVTNDVRKLSVGQAQYNMLCNEKGGTIDDLVVYRRSEEEIYICVNASNRAADFEWMRSHFSSKVTLEDESEQTALLAIQGPRAEEIMCRVSDESTVKKLKYYWAVDAKALGLPCYLSRTGYTGEDGFELYVKSRDAISVWEGLLEAGRKSGLVPCGLGARDTLRLEMGYPLHGHELSPEISPLSAGLGWVVKIHRTAPFIGQEALKQESAHGSPRTLKAFLIEDRRIARQGYRIANEEKVSVGEITSGTFSPHLNHPIALGFVAKEFSGNDRFLVRIREDFVPVKPAKLPFVPTRVLKGA